MCCHHRSRYGYGGYGRHSYGYNYPHHRGGPISALVALAVPLLTQNSTEKQALTQESYQTYQDPMTTRLAPQTSGRTVAPAQPRAAMNPTPEEEPQGPPPAYEDSKPSPSSEPLEKSLDNLYISTPPTNPLSLPPTTNNNNVGARDYQPLSRSQPATTQAAVPAPREIIGGISSDPSSRWAAKLQRKEDKVRAKLARKAEKVNAKLERKAERWDRRARREIERGY